MTTPLEASTTKEIQVSTNVTSTKKITILLNDDKSLLDESLLDVLSSSAPPPPTSPTPTVLPSHLLPLSEPYNSVFQTHLCPTTFFFRVFLLVFLDFFEVQRCFMDCRATFYSNAVFFMEGVLFLARSYFSSIFRILRGLFELNLLL